MTPRLPEPSIELLKRWMEIDSTSGRERALLLRLESDLTALGLDVSRQPVAADRWNILAVGREAPRVILTTHVDTVPPHIPPTITSDEIRGRGACDTTGGLFALWSAWHRLPEAARERVGFLLVVGEEVDHAGAIVAGEQPYPGLEAFVLCEPTKNRVARGQKGILRGVIRWSGEAGHSAFPGDGRSAVHAMLRDGARLVGESWAEDELLGPATMNLGVVTGGVAANVIAAEACAEFLMRTVTPRAEAMSALRARLSEGARVELTSVNDPLPLPFWPDLPTTVVPFNTDAPYLATRAPVVLVGPGDIRTAHSPRERLGRDELAAGIERYVELIGRILWGEAPATSVSAG